MIEGAAISEMPFTWAPRAHDFPRRNRLISGLWLGVVIVEVARRSGSLITARLAGGHVIALLGPPAVSIDDLVRLSRTSPAMVRTVRWNSNLPDGLSATAPGWYRSCNVR